jgi:hypothetical protein
MAFFTFFSLFSPFFPWFTSLTPQSFSLLVPSLLMQRGWLKSVIEGEGLQLLQGDLEAYAGV